MIITETAGATQSAAALKRELANVSVAKNELAAREHALRIQIGEIEGDHESSSHAAYRQADQRI
ncbi:hypothetical protein [Frigoribacterium sp. UYMn621]|uniref:hypothetical protein n=1 Tax=Frigoribacterium sp. UYMn621 TaxID=3156343 RepID=UPI0033995DEC